MSATMEDLERAVAIAYNIAQSPGDRPAADAFCNAVLESEDGFRRCISVLFESSEPAVHHFCLKAVEHAVAYRYLKLSVSDKTLIHDSLMQYYAFIGEHPDLTIYVREKFAQVIVALFRLEFLESWDSFIEEMRGPCEHGNVSCLDIYQRVLLAIDDYIISPESHRGACDGKLANDIKDKLRDGAIEKIAADWVSILRLGDDCLPLKKLALKTLEKYIPWMDIGLVVNDDMLPLLFAGLSQRKLQRKSCACLSEVVMKGMEPRDKVRLLLTLDVDKRIAGLNVENPKFANKLCKLINFIGVEALGAISFLSGDDQKAAVALSMGAVDNAMPFLEHDSNKVSSSSFELINDFIEHVRKSNVEPDEGTLERIGRILQICHTKLAFPAEFNHDDPDEFEDAFLKYRGLLGHLFRNIVRLQPVRVLQYVYNALDEATGDISAVSLIQLEVALKMMFLAGQDIPDREKYYPELITMIVERKVIEHDSMPVPLAFMETIVRYVRYIPRDEGLLSEVLQMFLGPCGLRHGRRRVRSRSCYFFFRLLKGLLDCIGPFVQPIIENLKPLLVVETNLAEDVITVDDQCALFEGLGSIIAAGAQQQATLVEHTLGGVMCQARGIFAEAAENPDQLQDPRFGVYVSRILKVVASFAQGFEKKDISHVKDVFNSSMTLCADALKMLPEDLNVRSQSIFLLHRMIQSLGEAVLESIGAFVEHLLKFLPEGDGKSLLEFFQLTQQLMSTFEDKAAPIIDSIFSPLVEKVAPYFGREDVTVRSEEGLECDRIQRQFFIFLKYLFSGNLVDVITSERNVQCLNDVIHAVMQPCSRFEGSTVGTKSICFKLLRKMCARWNNDEFCQIMVDHGFELIFAVPMDPRFVLTDGDSASLLVDITSFQRDALGMNEAMPDHLAKFLSSKGLGEDIVREYLTRLSEMKVREFATWLRGLIEHMRGEDT